MFGRQRAVVADLSQQLHRACGFKPVAILDGNVPNKAIFSALQVKARDALGFDVIVHEGWTAEGAQHNIRGNVIAGGDG